MALSFGGSFKAEVEKFHSVTDSTDFLSSVVPFVQFLVNIIETKDHSFYKDLKSWKVELYNSEKHSLFEHQVKAIRGCLNSVVLSAKLHSGYCFMPTSAGKGHILMTLAGLAAGNFAVLRHIAETMPDVWEKHQEIILPVLISISLEYSKRVGQPDIKRTQILVHDTEILQQLNEDCKNLLGSDLAAKIEFYSVQALRNEKRRANLKYVIVDECHWGNASEEETIQSSLITEVTGLGGKAFGFTASPYSGGKFQRTWSKNQLNADMGFNYYLENKILYEVVLREVNLQNARVDYQEGAEESDLVEKEQVIEYMVNHIKSTLPEPLDGPGICYFSSVIIPDIVESLFEKRPDLKPVIKVLASESAFFAEKCKEMFGPEILATDEDIKRLKAGEKIFLISRQKLLVGLNAPFLRYCFISPTNSKITIMQAIGRLMRPISREIVPRKLATLFLTSLTGKKLDITGKGSDPSDEGKDREPQGLDDHDNPKARYTTTSMTLSEAYDLPHRVFYKTEVGFKDFINESRIKDGNSVEVLKHKAIDPEALDKFDPMALKENVSRIRDMVRAQYKKDIWLRDSIIQDGKRTWICQGKRVLGKEGCGRSELEVHLEMHHLHPHTFAELYGKLGPDGVIKWHADRENLKYLVTLCEECHDKIHEREDNEVA